MKKFVAVLLAVLMMMAGSVFAEGAAPQEAAAPAEWYELSAEDTVLTVRLPGNTKNGLTWSFEISDSTALELITQETIEGESEGMAGAPTTLVASFMTTADTENTVSLILRCCDETDAEKPAVCTRVLEIRTSADNKLTVCSVLMQEPSADWVEFGDDGYILIVNMPDAAWSCTYADEEAMELIPAEEEAETFTASYVATMEAAGNFDVVFASDDARHFRSVSVFINESGEMFLNEVETMDILEDANLAYCEACGGWFEEGNIFRNHICEQAAECE